MNSESQDPLDAPGSSKFHTVQPHRDLQSNWAVDLAKSLEDYLLKICSGEITGADEANFSVNFAEAALLLQGSVQVYSRKVEYLYNLVLHALEFIFQTRSQDHPESSSVQAEASSPCAVNDENDQFWVLDEPPVETKNCLDNVTSKDTSLDRFIKPPANLVVLEGECLDSSGDGGELESYLLATNNLYRDFILLDPCDAVAVDEFLKGDKCEGQYCSYRGSSLFSKAHKSFLSPVVRNSGGTACKSSAKKGQNIGHGSPVGGVSEKCYHEFEPGPSNFGTPHGNYGFVSYDHHSQQGDLDDSDDEEDDPWKPLNPHEPGNLKVKPFKKVKFPRRLGMTKHNNIASQFPLAKLHGTITPELTKIWEMGLHHRKRQEESKPRLYEQLRESLAFGGNASQDTSFPPEDGDAENLFDDGNGIDDIDQPDFGIPDRTYMDDGVNIQSDQHDDYADHCEIGSADVNDDPNSQATLEDLCRAHLDSLLASIAENEKQTELAARVSTWKQRIEHELEEEDSRPPFDIHEYGETILDRLSLDEGESILSFTDVVKGQEKHGVARSFSALLQLVNDRKVDLQRSTLSTDSFCFTAENPFRVLLLSNEKGPKKMHFQPTKKRQKSPIKRQLPVVGSPSSERKSTPILAQPSCKVSVKLGKTGGLRCSPDGKRRRKSRLVE